MSTKTNFKRVALVAVAALGLGVLTSVAPASATPGLTIAANGVTSSTSRGLITAATGTTGLTNTASALSASNLYVTSGAGAATTAVAVSGATITTCDGGTETLNAAQTLCYNTDTTVLTFNVVPNAGVTSFTISQFVSAAYATESVRVTVSVVSAASIGAFSPIYSNIKVQHASDADGTLADTANADDKYTGAQVAGFQDDAYGAVTTTTRKNGVQGFLNFVLKDANNTALPTTTVLTATATGGCLVGLSTTTLIGASTSGTYDGTGGYIAVGQAAANTPYKCVVTLAVNGATVATRTFVLQGQVTKLVVADQVIAKSATTTTAALYVDAQDAAGNSVPDVTVTPVSSTYNTSVTSLSVPDATEVTAGTPVTATCDAKGTNAALKLYAQNASAALIYTDAFSLSCAGSPVNYSASLDKASYSIGEVATLTITAKDSAGNLTWDGAELGNSSTAAKATANAVSIAGGPMTQVGSIVSTDSFTSGVKKYKFTVGGISSGSFQLAVDLPALNSTTYSQSAVTVAYKVTAAADGGVSNADVLKAIVSLIASINKQIAALQKALLKK